MGHLPSDALGTGRTDSKEGEKTSITQKGIKKIKEDGRSRVQEGGLGLKARGQSQELKGGRYSLKREQSQLCRSTTQHTLNGVIMSRYFVRESHKTSNFVIGTVVFTFYQKKLGDALPERQRTGLGIGLSLSCLYTTYFF
ncbi:hypothetical protein FF1_033894 [Malus domestica]